MIDEIEAAVLARLQARWTLRGGETAVHTFDIANEFEDILKVPAVSVATESAGIRKLRAGEFEIAPLISVYCCFKNVSQDKGRRTGVYPMILGILAILTGHDMELEIDELEPVGSIQEVFHQNLKKLGLTGWKITFKTSFDIERIDDETAIQTLLSLGNYYDVNNNATVDAVDIVNL